MITRLRLPLTAPDEANRYRSLGLWRDRTLFEFFADSVHRSPTKIAIIDEERSFTYEALAAQVDRVAQNLLELGLEAQDVVALQSPNGAELAIVHLACNRVGLLFMPLHDSWRDNEMTQLLARSRSRVLITPATYRGFDYVQMVLRIREDLHELRAAFTLGSDPSGALPSLSELLEARDVDPSRLDAALPDPDVPAHIMLSGGTTAVSKIARFSSNDLKAMLDNFTRAAEVEQDDVFAALAPAGTGATGYVFPILTPLLFGATSAILKRWSPDDAVDLIVDHKCTVAVGIPAQLTMMVRELAGRDASEFEHFRLFYNSGAPLPYETGIAIEERMACIIQCMYGSTDGGVPVVTTVGDPKEKRLRTVGRVNPGFECEIWDPDGRPLPQGAAGEVVWRGPDKSWGYLGDDDETSRAFTRERFYKSGDLGEIDSDGYLRIVGRLKDMILRGGRNISPRTIEECVIKHPAVIDVAVAPMPDPVLGERACAFVVLAPAHELTFPEIVEFLKEQELAIWQLPERLEIVEDLPQGPGGKVLKTRLTALVTAKLEAETTAAEAGNAVAS